MPQFHVSDDHPEWEEPFHAGRASALRDGIERIQVMRDSLDDDFGLPGDEEAREDALVDLDSEQYGRYRGAEDTFERVLDVLQILAHGLTPAQGEPTFTPPEHLADAWRRYQAGEDVTTYELAKLDEARADWRESILG